MQPSLVTCKNCGNPFEGKYCNNCGEKVFSVHDKSIAHLLEEGFHFITHFDGKFFTTVKTMLTRPGKLSLDYCNGVRKKYYKPLSFFILLVVIYLLFPVAHGLNMPISAHIHSDTYGHYAYGQTIALMQSKQLSETYVVEHFQAASEKVSKILLLFIIPVMALWSWFITMKQKDKAYFDHFIFCTEVNAFMVLWAFLVFPLISRGIYALLAALTHHNYFSDVAFAVVVVSFITVYTFLAARRFYQVNFFRSVLYTVFFVTVYVLVIQYLYKFLLFVISLKLIH